VACGALKSQIIESVKDKTIEWRLDEINTGAEPVPRILGNF